MSFVSRILRPSKLYSLNTKLLLPIVGLMLVSLLASSLAFGVGTLLTRDQLLNRQIEQDQSQISQALAGRVEVVRSAAAILAADPDLVEALQAKTEANLAVVDRRAVLVRTRFQLDLIQVYSASGEPWVNLVLAELYRVSSLLDKISANSTAVVAVDGNLLLLSWSSTPNGGVVITGIDLGSELARLASDQRLIADLFIRYEGVEESSLVGEGAVDEKATISRQQLIPLGDSTVTLVVRRRTAEITQVTQTGLWVMIASLLLTTGLLIALASRITPAMTEPISRLAQAAQTVAIHHQFDVQPIQPSRFLLGIGRDDEIGQLDAAFRSMLVELRDLTQSLEQKVAERTLQLAAASAVARTANSSLEIETVLQTTVDTVCQQFGFYFAGVFIVEPDKSCAVLRAATGQVGSLFDGNTYLSLPLSQVSHITQAIQTAQPVVSQDISQSKTYLPHPMLPDTRAEAVFPLRHADNIIGALDIQASVRDAFSTDLLDTFATLSAQVAVAIQNAQLFRQQREIASRLAEIDHLKSQFLATVTHELRTPLNAILGFSRIIIRGMDGPLTEAQERDLTAIYESGQHLLSLIDDILDFSRIEAGQMSLDIQPVDLRREIIGLTAQVEEWIGDKPIRLELDLPAQMPPVEGDPDRLRQVLRHLLSNAVKFTHAGSVSVSAVYNPQWVVINIKDTGIGIAEKDMDKLFRPFSQVDGSSSRSYHGVGLGLSIARYLVELHGGKIWAESVHDAGTTFSFVLPIKQTSKEKTLQ